MEKPPFPTYIDSSARKTAISCFKKAEYEYIRHLKPKGPSIHLHFGACLAHGLEVYRKAFYTGAADAEGSLILATESIIKLWGDVEPPDYGTAANKSLGRCLEAIISFFEEYPPDTDPVKPVMTPDGPAVEWSFALPIPDVYHPTTGAPMLYVGRFDMLAEYGGAVFVNDEKTSGQLGDGWAKNWKLASQLTGYTWAASQFGFNMQGVIIRGIGILKTMIKHQFIIENRPQWMIDRWLVQLQRDVRRLISAWEEGYFDYALDDACSSYGGCPFLSLCTTKNPEPWIETDFDVRIWDPLEK